MMNKIFLDGRSLGVEDVVAVARGKKGNIYPIVELTVATKQKLKTIRNALEQRIGTEIMYGVNTGCGCNKALIIPEEEIDAYQEAYIKAHCCGVGDPFPPEIVRAAILLRVNSFALGYSGVRPELCERLLEMLNKNVIPYVPSKGSVGASGDLVPLAHIGSCLMGFNQAKVYYDGRELLPAREAFAKAGIDHLPLKAKEAMALTNGSTFILAAGVLAAYDLQILLETADIALALSLEAIRGEKAAFDPRIHEARNHQGQIKVAENVLRLTEHSLRTTEAAREVNLRDEIKRTYLNHVGEEKKPPRIQDAYSFRCAPQVHGPSWDALIYALKILEKEINSATDNPLVFYDEKKDRIEVLSGGNFHGQVLALPLDLLCIAGAELGNISDRRIFAQLDSKLSHGLPPNLQGESRINTGLMIAQYVTADLVSRNKVLSHPASSDSIPTSSSQEDHVSMAANAAWKLREIIENTWNVLAIELLVAYQGIIMTGPELGAFGRLGKGTKVAFDAIYKLIGKNIPYDFADRYLAADIETICRFIKSGDLVELVKKNED